MLIERLSEMSRELRMLRSTLERNSADLPRKHVTLHALESSVEPDRMQTTALLDSGMSSEAVAKEAQHGETATVTLEAKEEALTRIMERRTKGESIRPDELNLWRSALVGSGFIGIDAESREYRSVPSLSRKEFVEVFLKSVSLR